jgi:hypothetical protein
MAYFPNGTSGEVFDEQCGQCRYGHHPCPIAFAQFNYNYAAVNNETATAILDVLVKQDGTCEMFKMDEAHFYRDPADLFGEQS